MPKKSAQKEAKRAQDEATSATTSAAASSVANGAPANAVTSAQEAWPEGLCETAEGEALYRKGFPHLRWLVDEQVSDPSSLAARALMAVEPVLDFRWPRSVAERVVRGYMAIGDAFSAASPNDVGVVAAVQSEGAVGEPSALFRVALARDRTSKDFAAEDFVFLVEAFAGEDAVCDGILAALESDPSVLQRRGDALVMGRSLGFTMMRANGRDGFIARVAAMRERSVKHAVRPTRHWSALLATLIDGDAAFDDFGHALEFYVFVRDRARLVAKLLEAPGEFIPDMRFVYMGGPEVLDLYERRLDELPAGALARRFFHELSYVRRSIAAPLMQKLARRPDVGALATAWLERT
jgi:hypothetical protein